MYLRTIKRKNKNGTVVEINDKVEDLFGYKLEEVIGKSFLELGTLSPEELNKHLNTYF